MNRERITKFDGPACAAGRLTAADRIGIVNGNEFWPIHDSDPICAVRRFATPVELASVRSPFTPLLRL